MKYSFTLLAAAAAVQATPFPGGVTSKITPSAPAPSGCMTSYSGSFGIVAMNITAAAGAQVVSTISDGQPQASTGAVSQISDGQPQAPTATPGPISQISDGQPQGPTATAAPISQISDGQPQGPTGTVSVMPVSQISDGQPQGPTATMMMTMPAVSQISDGQIQATYKPAAPITQISDGQPQAPTMTASAVSQLSDGQPQAPTTMKTVTGSAVSQISDGQPQASASGSAAPAMATQMVACNGPNVLTLQLAGGVLTDNKGRTGYIASNYQFQFDNPPQAGAIYTAGFSVCGNGSLALGGSNVFYQCLSGSFYNLYNENWAPQCVPVTIDVLMLQNCS